MLTPFFYRSATPNDALCLSVLASQIFLDTYATDGINTDLANEVTSVYSELEFSKRLSDDNAKIIVVLKGDYLVGFLDLSFNTICPTRSVQGIEVLRLYVQAPFQGAGVGKKLMLLAEAEAQKRKSPNVWLTAWSGNTKALKFYPSIGYRDVGETQYVIEGRAYENRVFAKSIAESAA